eukprot:gnl/MRDRNA2_/MRDRNA2_268029_c0_seq1.p2 gnl/MRDRNA2_/MRDRNA2_268029_c0~~gnl/MRDRNA2_/MRDRNA2_268029_c0_seq1.p2  ORF type:complete len:112 (-),score=30.55 gnl/MRDRNA2_/MRDRNA2_268029_c0_seq1:10-345(-)
MVVRSFRVASLGVGAVMTALPAQMVLKSFPAADLEMAAETADAGSADQVANAEADKKIALVARKVVAGSVPKAAGLNSDRLRMLDIHLVAVGAATVAEIKRTLVVAAVVVR